ncbi:MAG: GNAT family N-acetyltransferase [Alphaproteobacteria bacterium]|nr:GNAT family N-acetyltransferase [Alphaproteobacteria bacterium]
MLKEVKRDDAIFKSEALLRDDIAYSIMFSILNNAEKYKTPKIFSDGKDCAVVNSDPNHAIIVWTADNFQEYGKLYEFIKKEFRANKPFAIWAKNDFYDYLVKNKIIPELKGEQAEDGHEKLQTLGTWSCSKLNDIPYIGHPDQAKPEEVQKVAQMMVNFDVETKEEPHAKMSDDYVRLAQKFVSNPLYFVWRDKDEKLVATATLDKSGEYPRVGRVFTDEDERGKTYAKMLVHYITNEVFKEGKVAMLYTDYDYPSSNRCYQGVGYKLSRTIVKFMPPITGQDYIKLRNYRDCAQNIY